jgi:hypothetical protein
LPNLVLRGCISAFPNRRFLISIDPRREATCARGGLWSSVKHRKRSKLWRWSGSFRTHYTVGAIAVDELENWERFFYLDLPTQSGHGSDARADLPVRPGADPRAVRRFSCDGRSQPAQSE